MTEEVLRGETPHDPPEVDANQKKYLQEERDFINTAVYVFCNRIGMPAPSVIFARKCGEEQTAFARAYPYRRKVTFFLNHIKKVSYYEIVEIVQHELIHILYRKNGHGKEFQKLCSLYGVSPLEENLNVVPRYLEWLWLQPEFMYGNYDVSNPSSGSPSGAEPLDNNEKKKDG